MPDFGASLGGGPGQAGVDAAASRGITLAFQGTLHAKGPWTEIISATTVAAGWLMVHVHMAASAIATLVDVAIGPAGSEQVLVESLHFHQPIGGSPTSRSWVFPCAIPAGTRISARSSKNGPMNCGVTILGGPLTAPISMSPIETAGVNTAASRGTEIDPGGTAHAMSAWVELSAATAHTWRWVCLGVGHAGGAMTVAGVSWLVDLGIGPAGQEVVLASLLPFLTSSATDSPLPGTMCFPCLVPAGSRVTARVQCSTGTSPDRLIDVILHGVG